MATTDMKQTYKFGTSGYRSDVDEAFNETVIRQITNAIGDYLVEENEKRGKVLPVLIGGDTREKTRQFIPVIAQLLKEKGLDVFQADGDVPSPVLAYAAKYIKDMNLGPTESLGAILMTASHNPWEYGGYNFLTPDAAVMPTPVSKAFEALQENPKNKTLDRAALGETKPAEIRMFDPYTLYAKHLKHGVKINYAKIKESGLKIYYDPLYATGRRYFPRLLKDEGIEITMIHDTDVRPEGYGGMPEPTGSNLTELTALIQNDKSEGLKVGFANDGDSDRFGVLDETGRYLNPNEVLSLALYHLLKNRKQSGVIVRSQATTHLLDALAEQAGLKVVQSPVGYKYIAEEFIEHEEHGDAPVLIGGESSGGLSIDGHIPEKDGLLANLLIADLIATENKPLSEILKQVQASVPKQFTFRELGVKTPRGKDIMAHFQKLVAEGGKIADLDVDNALSTQSVQNLEKKYGTKDGAKLYMKDGSWLLIRASGTEPIVRVYAEGVGASTQESFDKSQRLLDAVTQTLTQDFGVPSGDVKEKK